jgi:hypothetical protein
MVKAIALSKADTDHSQMRVIKPDAVILRSRRAASPLGQVNNPIFSPLLSKTSAVATINLSCISVIADKLILCSITALSIG